MSAQPISRLSTEIGVSLPEQVIEATPTFIVSTALATRDFQDVHHDRDRALARGAQDIFLNILTSTGLVQRYVSEWAGPGALVQRVAIRLGVPCHAYATLTLSGQVTEREGAVLTVAVVGRVTRGGASVGDHVTGTVTVRLVEQG